MSIIAMSARFFPALSPSTRVSAAGRASDSSPEDRPAPVLEAQAVDDDGLPPTEAVDVVNALLEVLDDAELAALERLDDETIDSLARELQLRGFRRTHPHGFVSVVA